MWKAKTDNDWVDCGPLNDKVEEAFQKGLHIFQGNTFGKDGGIDFIEMLHTATDGSQRQIVRSHVTTPGTKELAWGFEACHGEFVQCNPHMSALLTIARRNKLAEIVVHDYHLDHRHTSKRVFLTKTPIVQRNEHTMMIRVLNPAPTNTMCSWKRPYPDYADAPDNFKCPITYELMYDPVIAADGHTYERHAIEETFTRSKIKSPMTNEHLDTPVLYPNVDKRKEIQAWLDTNHTGWSTITIFPSKKASRRKVSRKK